MKVKIINEEELMKLLKLEKYQGNENHDDYQLAAFHPTANMLNINVLFIFSILTF